jgi:alpha-ketoglutarate-dependent taurine dioxygenase
MAILPRLAESNKRRQIHDRWTGGGRKYWSDAARAVGILEDEQSGMLRFLSVTNNNNNNNNNGDTTKKQERY